MNTLLEQIAQGVVLVSDGAMGTFLHAQGLGLGECPESWCILHPDVVKGIAEAYIGAGSEIVETNSFGGSPLKLKHYGLADKTRELNRAAAALARDAMITGSMTGTSFVRLPTTALPPMNGCWPMESPLSPGRRTRWAEPRWVTQFRGPCIRPLWRGR
jgi:methionine synthase I (cobalamin-dependent)